MQSTYFVCRDLLFCKLLFSCSLIKFTFLLGHISEKMLIVVCSHNVIYLKIFLEHNLLNKYSLGGKTLQFYSLFSCQSNPFLHSGLKQQTNFIGCWTDSSPHLDAMINTPAPLGLKV